MKVNIKMSIDLHTVEVKNKKELIEALEKYRTRNFKTLTIDTTEVELDSITIIRFPDRFYVNLYIGPAMEDNYAEEIFDAKDFDEIIEKAKKFFEVKDENK